MLKLLKPFEGDAPVTQGFGENPGAYQYICRADGSHNGVDYGLPVGTAVMAAADGVVMRADRDASGYGLHVRIQHADEQRNMLAEGTLYAHLFHVVVKVGDIVSAGQIIGLSGGNPADAFNAGNSTGPHLHFEYRTNLQDCTSCADPLGLMEDEEPPSDSPLKEGVTVAVGLLNIRLTPGGRDVGDVLGGDQLQVAGDPVEKDGITWIPVVVWAAKGYNGEIYLE